MSSARENPSDERDRSSVEKLAAGLIGSGVVKEATSRALAARERAVEMQELTMGALNLPTAAVIDRLTRRVRSVALRLEGIEDALDRLEDRIDEAADAGRPADTAGHDAIIERLEAIERRLEQLHKADGSR